MSSENETAAADQPTPEAAPQPAAPQLPTVELTDEQAGALLAPLAHALQTSQLFEGMSGNSRAAFERVVGPLALGTAARLLQMMRGQPLPKDVDVQFTLRQIMRGAQMSVVDQQRLMALRPGVEFAAKIAIVGEDGKTPEAEVVIAAKRHGVITVGGAKFPDTPAMRDKFTRDRGR